MLPRITNVVPPTLQELRHVAVALIARGIDPDTPISDSDMAWGHKVAEALGLRPVLSVRYRDPVTRAWKTRDMTQTEEPVNPARSTAWECDGQASIDELLPNEDDDEDDPTCRDC